jgi:hypothetical protein
MPIKYTLILLILIQGCTPTKHPNAIMQNEYDVYSVLIKKFVVPALKTQKIIDPSYSSDSSYSVFIHHNTIKGFIYSGHGQNDTILNL